MIIFSILVESSEDDGGFFTSTAYGIILLIWLIIVTIFLILMLCLYIAARRRNRRRQHQYGSEKNRRAGANAYTNINGTINSGFKSTEMNNINHQVPGTPTPVGRDPEWIGSMKEDFVTDYSIETISDGHSPNSNVYSTYSLPTDTHNHGNKYARVKRQHVNGDLGTRGSLHSLQEPGATYS